MELNYIEPPTNQGGAAVPGCGTINWMEIRPTLDKLSDDLELPFDLNDYTLGSTGKRDFSGDIDLVIDDKWWGHGVTAFRENLEKVFGKENVARNGDMLHLKYEISPEVYIPCRNDPLPRTGFVQIDFNFGDPVWERFYHFSPGDYSAYKGAHRNLAIAALTASIGVTSSSTVDGQNRPTKQVRYKFGPKGLILVSRKSVKDPRSGDWKKKQEDSVIEGPCFDPDLIAKAVFDCKKAVSADLDSLETIMAATKRFCGMVEQERVWSRMAYNFYDWPAGRNFYYPQEISRYLPSNDK